MPWASFTEAHKLGARDHGMEGDVSKKLLSSPSHAHVQKKRATRNGE